MCIRDRNCTHRKNKKRSRSTRNPSAPSCRTRAPSPTRYSRPSAPVRSPLTAHRSHRSPAATFPRSPHPLSHHSATPPPTASPGGARHAASSGTSADSPSAPSTLRTESGSWIAASTRRTPEPFGQTKTSKPNAHGSNSASRTAADRPHRAEPAAARAPAAPPDAYGTWRRRRSLPPWPPRPQPRSCPRRHHQPRAGRRRLRLLPRHDAAPPATATLPTAPAPRDMSPGASAAAAPARKRFMAVPCLDA